MIRIPYVAATVDLDDYLSSVEPYYHLYTNNVLVTPAVVKGSFAEANYPGYAPKPARHWTAAVINSGRAVSYADPLQFACASGGGPPAVYGYFVTDSLNGDLLWWEPRGAGPLPLSSPTDSIVIRPRLTLREDPADG